MVAAPNAAEQCAGIVPGAIEVSGDPGDGGRAEIADVATPPPVRSCCGPPAGCRKPSDMRATSSTSTSTAEASLTRNSALDMSESTAAFAQARGGALPLGELLQPDRRPASPWRRLGRSPGRHRGGSTPRGPRGNRDSWSGQARRRGDGRRRSWPGRGAWPRSAAQAAQRSRGPRYTSQVFGARASRRARFVRSWLSSRSCTAEAASAAAGGECSTVNLQTLPALLSRHAAGPE